MPGENMNKTKAIHSSLNANKWNVATKCNVLCNARKELDGS